MLTVLRVQGGDAKRCGYVSLSSSHSSTTFYMYDNGCSFPLARRTWRKEHCRDSTWQFPTFSESVTLMAVTSLSGCQAGCTDTSRQRIGLMS